ncbi:serine hydrolase domain-containing protein [Flavobacterium sp. RSP15]|uniref:serine hydrolase domain-containing protein n=1 Tax=Flavobacterium sp. RSP15 TaxID=2497485 RepID=UPI000F83A9E9|nr:serine hydrolase domain-containing protein [Flavobacterium sp. RSP15]RTY87828.1 class A beta-lactamase-related serine hydrolase [Flavobacterium sp. RSP15]
MKFILFLLIFFKTTIVTFGQQNNVEKQIDILISAKTTKQFNGIILISQKGKTKYSKMYGYSDIDKKKVLRINDQFVIGSISKQFTAVLVLREFDKGHLDLSTPIHTYLPELTQSWADTVTAHHLLTHMHGITQIDRPTTFKVGTQYSYSQIGYDLLAKIIEKTSGKSFAELSKNLFKECGMKNTFHPNIKEYDNLVKGYTEIESGKLEFENKTFQNYVAAGSFISTAKDLNIWNKIFYSGKLLENETMKMLETKQQGAVRKHPIFGITEYGYGITIDTNENILQLGQTGFAPGFVSMSYYFPKSQTNVIVLENIAYDTDDLKKTFYYHTEILKIIRNEIKNYR